MFVMRTTLSGLFALTMLLPFANAAAQPRASRWKEIGKTSVGNTVYVDPRSVKTVNGIITARLRVKFLKQEAPEYWWQSHHLAMFDCAKKLVAAKESVYYTDEAATKVVRRTDIKIPGYGPAIGGSMTKVALDYFCPVKP
jgi:hypothetical protein